MKDIYFLVNYIKDGVTAYAVTVFCSSEGASNQIHFRLIVLFESFISSSRLTDRHVLLTITITCRRYFAWL